MNDALGEELRGAATSWVADSYLDDVGTRARGDRHINPPVDVGRWLDRRLNTIAISPHFTAFNIIQAYVVLAPGVRKSDRWSLKMAENAFRAMRLPRGQIEFDINPSFVVVCDCLDCRKASNGEAATSIAVPTRWSRLLALQEVLGIHPSSVAGIEHHARFRLLLKPVTMVKRLCRRVDQRPFV